MEDDPSTIDASVLDQKVQINTRVPIRLRMHLDQYRKYMERPETERPQQTHDWPRTVEEIVSQALKEFLAKHPQKERPGPERARARPVTKKQRKE